MSTLRSSAPAFGRGEAPGPAALRPGRRAPEVVGRTHHGEELRLGALAGSPVLVMFYPFAFSRVCGAELAALQDRGDELRDLGVRTAAISCDAVHTLRAYAEQLADDASELAVDLVSDFWPHGAIARSFGVFDAERGTATRTSFLLDADLVIRHVQQVPVHRARDLEETVQVLRELSGRS